jgi:heme oxygenase
LSFRVASKDLANLQTEFSYEIVRQQDLIQMQSVLDEYFAKKVSFSETVGLFYVVTGSIMGGQILKKRIAVSLSDHAISTHYFDAFGALNKTRWQTFLQFLDALETQKVCDQAELINGAQMAFYLIEKLVFIAGQPLVQKTEWRPDHSQVMSNSLH